MLTTFYRIKSTLLYFIIYRLRIYKLCNAHYNCYYDGKFIKAPFVNGMGAFIINHNTNNWMSLVLKDIIPLFKTGGYFLDIGANIGQTFIKVYLIDSNIKYYAIEPNPTCVHYLHRLKDANNFTNLTIMPIAIASDTSLTQLFLYSKMSFDPSASILPNFRKSNKIFNSIYIPVFSITNLTSSIVYKSHYDIIKIDVEGSESSILMEFEQIIVRDRPIILVEILPVYNAKNINRFRNNKTNEEFVDNNNYQILRILKHNSSISYQHIQNLPTDQNIQEVDYILCPSEKLYLLRRLTNFISSI